MNREYLDRAEAVLKRNFRPNDPTGSMTAASAAFLLKRSAGDYTLAGFPKFKDLLDALEGRRVLRQGTNSKKALAIWLPPGNFEPKPVIPNIGKRLRKDVWFAFVAKNPQGRRYLHPRTGALEVGCTSPMPLPWVEIEIVNQDNCKRMARQFLQDNSIVAAGYESILEGDTWYSDFPKKLASESESLPGLWNRHRSAVVVEHVLDWCNRNSVLPDRVFELPDWGAQVSEGVNAEGSSGDLREALLEAIAKMSIDELLKIQIPAIHLVAALRPDLAQ